MIKTLDFLPIIFQTPANQKFLNATLDQLVTQPNFKRVNGFIGRKFAPTFKVGDNYVPEPTAERQNYQLEPSVVSLDSDSKTQFFSTYTDLLQQISYYGGLTNNHTRLFSQESYSFDGQVDFDKFVNFSQYYWLPDGPDTVSVNADPVGFYQSYTVDRNLPLNGYTFSGHNNTTNPELILARGGTYQFSVNQPGFKFWIQSEPGTTGIDPIQPNINTRPVLGVTNNGTDNGVVTFTVPQADAQDGFITMPIVQAVDYATLLHFTDIDNQLVQNLAALGGIDGVTSNLDGKYIIFINPSEVNNDSSWLINGLYGLAGYGVDPYNLDPYDSYGQNVTSIPGSQRTGVWQIHGINVGGNQIIKLSFVQSIPQGEKVFVKAGNTYANFEFYKTVNGFLDPVPLITASLNTLYYQDDTLPNFYGIIRIVNSLNYNIEVDSEILGQKNYTSPNGVAFTNGLKVTFNNNVTPSSYANKTYYVEGVGIAIQLIDVTTLITPEFPNGLITPDYLTINRSSIDTNAWSRSNRWFHLEVIAATSKYNNTVPMFNQLQRASRPVIEFNANLQLFNYGRIAKPYIDLIDFTITDAFTQIQNAPITDWPLLTEGETVIFAGDFAPTVTSKIYTINFVTEDSVPTFINLIEATNGNIQNYDVAAPVIGMNTANGLVTGKTFWFNGTTWIVAQQKTAVNQSPLFDIIDTNLNSFSDINIYNASTFAGCKILSYLEGTGTADPALGFPISYRNISNVGDIEFTNNYDTDTFSQLVGITTIVNKVDSGFIPHIADRNTLTQVNMWTTRFEKSKQYQIIPYIYNGTTSSFIIDILPDQSVLVPNLKVYVNSKELSTSSYAITQVGSLNYITISSTLSMNDEIDILIYSSTQISKLGYYEIPSNLDFNALNENFSVLTHGQFRNHLATIASNTTEIVGEVPGDSNLRDLDVKAFGGTILQHSAPVIYSELFLLNKDLSFVDASTYAQREYSRFKNRFLEAFPSVVNAGITDPVAGVDSILHQINAVKNNQSPWYYSDMVPYGATKTTINYTVLNLTITAYEIPNIFNDTMLSNQAVLVYLNGTQLLKGNQYTFDQARPAIDFTVSFNYNDTITIEIYSNTDGNFIPETPTKLGLWPKFTPEIFTDTSYQTPTQVLRGHDGSITPTFGDMRDELLLELEKRIYNNIKIQYSINKFDILRYIPGKFRATDYNKDEFDTILSRGFMEWISNNRTDYTDNLWFQNGNPWSWTYSSFKDVIDGSYLPGYWKGIYNYFFDTEAPHLRPWEMLGFSEMPSWWVSLYGPAPYTGGNMVLWDDLEAGIIRQGPSAGTYSQYARPGLSTVIPVDASGNLKSPNEFLVTAFNGANVDGAFVFGDEGPVETAWRTSSDYPFAVQQALAVMKPALYFSQLSNVSAFSNTNETKQWLFTDTNQRISISTFEVNGETVTTKYATPANPVGTILRQAGYLNWISDYITGYGANGPTQIHKYLDSLQVKLGYRVAGFTGQNYINVYADQVSPTSTGTNESIVIPDENYQVYVHKSSPIANITYSGVIIEKTALGFSVSGYSADRPYFTIIPSNPNNNFYTIAAAGATGVIYNNYQTITVNIPYGQEFVNKQQVVDFLVSYSRYLTSQGFSFTDIDPNLQVAKDWILAAKEFLTWTQQGWAVGNIIVVSPISNSITLSTPTGVVDAITNTPSGSKVLDVGFNVIKSNYFSVIRDNGTFTLTTTAPNISIGLLDVSVVQYENALIFDNETVFNDIIYSPSLGNRQFRLKLIGSVTQNWTGEFNPPGFIYNNPTVPAWQQGKDYRQGDIVTYNNFLYTALQDIIASNTFNYSYWSQIDSSAFKTGMLPNFSYNASKFEDMYDVDNQVADENINEYAMGLIGYRDRDYLTQLRVDTTSQVKFYQGFIKEKGTTNAVSALANATFENLSGKLNFYEEWAFRVGSYGATASKQFIEVQLPDSVYTFNPISFELLDSGQVSTDVGVIGVYDNILYKKPLNYQTAFIENRSAESIYANDITSAGYVNLQDVDATVFNINDTTSLNALVPSIHTGYKLWVAKDKSSDWNVYRVEKKPVNIIDISYQLNSYALFTTNGLHNLIVGDIFVVQGFSTSVDGFYTVLPSVYNSPNTIFAAITSSLDTIMKVTPDITGNGLLYVLKSVRVKYQTDILGITPTYGWIDGDTVWIDTNDTSSNWATYQKSQPWNLSGELTANTQQLTAHSKTGSSVASSLDGLIALAGAPALNNGAVKVFNRAGAANYIPSATILPDSSINKANIQFQLYSNVTLPQTVSFSSNVQNLVTVVYDIGTGIPVSPSLYRVNTSNVELFNVGSPITNNYKIIETVPEEFGTAVDIQQGTIVVGAPTYQSNAGINTGRVSVYNVISGQSTLVQQIDPDAVGIPAGSYFGTSVSLSSDAQWLYVGAPAFTSNVGSVYAFRLNNQIESFSQSLQTDGTAATPSANVTYPLATNVSADLSGITVSSIYYTLQPNVDFTILGNSITFSGSSIGLTYQITQRPYYDFCAVLEPTDGHAGDNFGSSVKTQSDGSYVIVGAPGFNSNTGQAYAFNRSVQKIIADGIHTQYTLYQPPGLTATYYLDDVEFIPSVTANVGFISSTTLEFDSNLVPLNTVIRADLNNFSLVQEINDTNALSLTNNATFGYAVTLSSTNDEIFIGAPAINGNIGQDGRVYRYTNISASYDNTLVDISTLTNSANIIINDQVVGLMSANVADINSVINAIDTINNNVGIIGLTTSNENGNLRLSYTSSIVGDALNVLVIDGNISKYSPYTITQTINHPLSFQHQYQYTNSEFGSALAYEEQSGTLVVAGLDSPLIKPSQFDNYTLTFDTGTTTFYDVVGTGVNEPGAAFVFQELFNPLNSVATPSQFIFTELLQPTDLIPGADFGSGISISHSAIFVGANLAAVNEPNNAGLAPESGALYFYSNPSQTQSWQLIRNQTPQVDLDNVTRTYLYDSASESMLAMLDFIDPAKGKILGIADQDITYKSAFDPARYNTGTNGNVSLSTGFCWGAQQVGQIWWNLNQVRYIDYEQDTLTYRIKHWGELFPGSVIEVNEWVESSVLPSQYAGDGTVKYPDDSAYVQATMVSPTTGFIVSTYYFWVTNRTQLDSTLPWRTSTASTIASLIQSPSTQNIPYAMFIQDNAVSLVSSSQYINADQTILHIDYAVVPNENIIHNEWALVQENSVTSLIPTAIVNKMIDSITGADTFGNPVPDVQLGVAEKYGITIRPRQTMFVNAEAAAKNLVEFCNNIFLQSPIVDEFDLSGLYLAEPVPTTWDPKNVSVNTPIELTYLDPNTLTVGQIILVLADPAYNNGWAEYKVQADKSFIAIRTQTYQTTNYWSKIDWFDSTYDSTAKPTYTVATIADMSTLTLASGNIVWVTNNGAGLFVVYRVNSDLSTSLVGQQQGTIQLSDALWNHAAFEIGFDNDRFDTVKFDLNPTTEFRNIINTLLNDIFIKTLAGEFNNLFFVLLNYIMSEQRLVDWAFKTSFVSVIQQLRKLEQFPNYIEDNQTYYEAYINEIKPYRTTIREYVIDYEGNDTANIHPADFDLPAYYDTEFNMWRSPSGEHAKDALLLSTQPQYADWYNNHTYAIGSVEISSPGYGYTFPPQLTVVGGGGTGTILTANIDLTTGSITGVTVVNTGSGYISTPTIVVQGNGVDPDGNQTCRLYPVFSNNPVRSFNTTLKFDRVSYTANITPWSANTVYSGGELVSYNNRAYSVTGNVQILNLNSNTAINSGSVFETADYVLLSEADTVLNAADRVIAYYNPIEGMPPKDLADLFSGIEYPGNLVDGSNFVHATVNGIEYTIDSNGNRFVLDSNIQSSFADSLLGTRPEDINIDGGKFVDTYSGHAPEELIAGTIYDTLDLKVFTIDSLNANNAPIGYRMTKTMLKESITIFDIAENLNFEIDEVNRYSATTTFDSKDTTFDFDGTTSAWEFKRICSDATTTLAQDLWISNTNIAVTDTTGLFVPDPVAGIPGVIYLNSEKIVYWKLNVDPNGITGNITNFRRGAWGTGSPAVVTSIAHPWAPFVTYAPGQVVTYANVTYIANVTVSGNTIPSSDPSFITWANSIVLPSEGLVVDASSDQTIPGSVFTDSWLDLASPQSPGIILAGNGLRNSTTVEASFIKSCSINGRSYLPFLPGQSGAGQDPNLYHTRFDDDGTEGGSGTIHPFDIDPFDSWTVG